MIIVGITGQIGAGKSEVLKYLQDKNDIVICDADKVGHYLQKKGEIGYEKIVQAFGTRILDDNLEINRRELGKIAFADTLKLQLLDEIMHPLIKSRIQELIAEAKNNRKKFFILEAALLLEGDYQDICDEIWYIYTQVELRMKRVMQSRGYSKEKFLMFNQNQMSDDEIRNCSHRIIDNSKNNQWLYDQIEQTIEEAKKKWQE